jgi:diguanylate cyclase (GGDEF)-like protein
VLIPVPLYALAQWRVSRQPAMKRVFNTAAMAVAGFAAATLHPVLAGRPAPYSLATFVQGPRQASAVLVTAVVPALVSTLLVAIALRLVMPGISWRRALGSRDGLGLDLVEACLGILLAVVITVAPGLLVLALPPVLLLQRTLLHAELLEAARTDAKTGLANPAHWRTVAERELRRARQGGEPLAVLMVDIDHFKAVNDDYGHVVGDRVLAAVGGELQAGLRPRDLVGRFGGEEFAVLLPGTSRSAAEQTAQRLRRRVQQLACPAGPGGRGVRVTISVGVAFMCSPAVDVAGLVDAADAALYRAKGAGRNRVVTATDHAGTAHLAVPRGVEDDPAHPTVR